MSERFGDSERSVRLVFENKSEWLRFQFEDKSFTGLFQGEAKIRKKCKGAMFALGGLLTCGPSSSFHQTILLSVHSQGYPELPGTGSDCVTHGIYVRGGKARHKQM